MDNCQHTEIKNRTGLNLCYTFIALTVALLVSFLAGTVAGWIVSPTDLHAAKGDLSHNYYVAYLVRGLVTVGTFAGVLYLAAKLIGHSVSFSRREVMTKRSFLIETVPALVLFFGFSYWLAFDLLGSWYLSGTLAALFGIIKASNLYSMEFAATAAEGRVTVITISLQYYLWLQLLLDLLFTVGYAFLLYKGRKVGEQKAGEEHEKQLSQMEAEMREKSKSGYRK